MKHYVKDKSGRTHTIEEYGWENGKITLCLDDSKIMTLKMYFRNERTWNDHMGNTPCGYYAIVPITKKERKRIYLNLYK